MRNPLFKGVISHKGEHFEGEHEAIIPAEDWDGVQSLIKERNRRKPHSPDLKGNAPYLLRGLLVDADGWAMTPGHGGNSKKKRYRYYISTKAIKHGYGSTEIKSVSAEQIEPMVIAQLKKAFARPEIIALVHRAVAEKDRFITLDKVRKELMKFDGLWDQLFPLEQHRLVQLMIKRVRLSLDGLDITYQPNGIGGFYEQLTDTQRAS